MSDRVSLQVWVWDCPRAERASVAEALSGYVEAEFEGQISLDTGWLVLGRRYINNEIPRGSARVLAGILREQAPGASWLLWEDPFEGSLGSLHAHTPGLGDFDAECDGRGQVLFTLDEVHVALAAAMGQPWIAEWASRRRDVSGPCIGEDLTPEEVTSHSWPLGTTFRPVSSPAGVAGPAGAAGTVAWPGRQCSYCGAIVEPEDGAGFWVTGEDAPGARRHCTDSPDHLHHPR